MSSQVSIDPMVAYSEASHWVKMYQDRCLFLTSKITDLTLDKKNLEAEIARLNGIISQGQQEIKEPENGSS